jgi:hypothetical protein
MSFPRLRSAPSAVPALALVAVLLACGESGPADTRRLPTADPASANVVVWVSNQSFIDETVRITVRLDNRTVIDQDFDVEGQHNWIDFPLAVSPGEHEFTVTSDTQVRRSDRLTVPATGRRYVVIDHWRDHKRDGGRFSFQSSDQPVGFA